MLKLPYLSWLLFSVLTLIFPLNSVEKSYSKIPFSIVTKNDYWLAIVSIGTPDQILGWVLDIGSERTWVHYTLFNSNLSQSYINKSYYDTKEQEDFIYKGIWSADSINVGNMFLKEFDFVLVDTIITKNAEKTNQIFGIMSWGRDYDSKKFSLVYRLTAASATFSNSFSFEFTSNTNGNLYIGDLNDEIKDSLYMADTCDLITFPNKIKWGCLLTDIFIGDIGNKVYDINERNQNIYEIKQLDDVIIVDKPVYFETVLNRIILPKDSNLYIKYFEDYYFLNRDSGDKWCQKTTDVGRIYFTCTSSEIIKWNYLNIVFDRKLAFVYKPSDLFKCIANNCEFLIEANSITNKEDIFLMGIPGLRKYFTEFNFNLPKLTFYSKVEKEKNLVHIPRPNEGNHILKQVWIFFLIVAVACILGIGVIYYLRKKNLYKKNLEIEIYQKL